MHKKRILLYPYLNEGNEYIEIQKRMLRDLGFDVTKLMFKSLIHRNTRVNDIIVINWLEFILFKPGGVLSLTGIFRFGLLVLGLKLKKLKLVYVKHNFQPHFSNNVTLKIYKCAEKMLMHFAYKTICHRKGICNTHFIPHPLYSSDSVSNEIIFNKRPRFLIFGAIKPYKGIDKLLLDWPQHEQLLICGKCKNDLKAKLDDIIKQRNLDVKIKPGFVSDEDLESLVLAHDVIVLPHMSNTAIVSGAFFYAKSFGSIVLMRGEDKASLIGDPLGVYTYIDRNSLLDSIQQINISIGQLSRHTIQNQSCDTNSIDRCLIEWRNVLT